MKKDEEIVSLNSISFEQREEMSLDERLQKLASNELNAIKAGGTNCPTNCPTNYCRECVMNHCDVVCELHDCPYDNGWICPCDGVFDDCFVMGGQT